MSIIKTKITIFNPYSILVILSLLCLPCQSVCARQLYWQSMEVDAHLDSEGALRVTETLAMVFDGDWNGGERTFDIRAGQRLTLLGMERRDAGHEFFQPLTAGSLNAVDHYKLDAQQRLRWRARRASDPPFRHQLIEYRIHYRLKNIVIKSGESYRLNHDFAFPNRQGPINHFSLRFDVDPDWQLDNPSLREYQRDALPPGQGVVLNIPLHYSRAGEPRYLFTPRSTTAGTGSHSQGNFSAPLQSVSLRDYVVPLGLLVLLSLYLSVHVYRRERLKGYFAPLKSTQDMPEDWIETNLYRYKPEMLGALWDNASGAPEVGALLSRLILEEKLKTSFATESWCFFFRREVMSLTLQQDISDFTQLEQKLLKGLFVEGNVTNPDMVKRYYREHKKDFSPASTISSNLMSRVRQIRNQRGGYDWLDLVFGLLAYLGSPALFWLVVYQFDADPLFLTFCGLLLALYMILGISLNNNKDYNQQSVFQRFIAASVLQVVVAPLYLALVVNVVSGYVPFTHPAEIIVLIVALALLHISFSFSWRVKDSSRVIAIRRDLAAIRLFIKEQLKQPRPQLKDEWYPYIIAFGLESQLTKWTRRFQVADSFATGVARSSFDSSGSHGAEAGWSGGGGAFGGAGASASWGAYSSAVAGAPSSSGSGGGGSSGGGSSGGGGGGGW